MERSAIVIGSGLGGLQCGHILSRHGWKVTVLEQHSTIGGCMQSFRRGSATFDTGLHFVGGAGEDGGLESLFADFGLMELPWKRLDGEEVCIGGQSFFLPSGYPAYEEALCGYFPSSADEIKDFVLQLRQVDGHPEYMEMNAYSWLCKTISDPLLRKVVSGTSLKMELDSKRLPLYTFARINDAFIRGTWRLRGGGSQLAEKLAEGIRSKGGDVLTGKKVTALESNGGAVSAVLTEDGDRYSADVVVSDIHPSALVAMTDGLRKIYRTRVASLENTKGLSTVNIRLRDCAPAGENRSVYVHSEDADLWNPRTDVLETVGISFGEGTVDLMTRTEFVSREELVDRCVEFVSCRLPWLRDAIDAAYVSTPSTYERYTGTPGGSAYGLVRDCSDIMRTSLSVRTPLANLYLTGQNIGIHGVLGVTKSSYRTCEKILGKNI
ncbi:MAG: NAD(P)/FAD-dependent oxidoreductase [Bacteroidales bacterium]|nr:NAD(P)/FAD-dependent oxidoreductase [Bacteroidales bacterium]